MNESALKPYQLYQKAEIDDLPFTTTDDFKDVPQSASVIGQPRAEQALHFGVGIDRDGYNIFALGDQGTGKYTFISDFLKTRAKQEKEPEDICYVSNFDQQHMPRLLTLKAGQGKTLADDMKGLIEDVRNAMRAALENEEYQNRAQSFAQELEEKQRKAFEELRRKARERGLVAVPTPSGLAFTPKKEDSDQGLSSEEYENLSEEEKERIEKNAQEMQKEAQRVAQNIPQWQREVREKQKAFQREVTEYTIDPLVNEMKEKYADYKAVQDYLQKVRDDLIENVRNLFPEQQQQMQQMQQMQQQGASGQGGMGMGQGSENPAERRYHVNVLVDHSESEGAPVVYEENPTYQNLFGRVEHLAQMGALVTDFKMIRPGAMHRANGGYLILDALKVVREPFAWEGLKRTLRSGELKIESIGQMYSLISTVSLEPEALPIRVKVVLTGIPLLYYLLRHYDPDFGELFKVSADFAQQMDRGKENQHEFVRLMAGVARREELLPFKRDAVGRVIERGSRLIGDARKMSIHMESMTNLLREADYWARQNGRSAVESEHVQKAVDSWIYRSDRLRERMQEQIERDIVLIDTDGSRVGQVNGLSVLSLGDFMFGRPSRITARIRLGKGEVVDIEREVAMGGPIHSKGVLILSGFLGGRYALDAPLSLSASLVFEQSYGGIEGDSASSAELYALLSAIADVPIRQSLGITGSVNQHGRIQPIGGVNEKIEGFFDTCKAKGLSKDQGVLIPAANTQHLMLRQDVIDAVEAGNFFIHAVETIDQGLEILSGLTAGEPDESGVYP
ncbi:MAG: AAA family ATPase, partial [Desulfohalobiaceae bacterium]|nr:AAA family ATPase [Desulfohalobiaceae bacterium]